MKCDCGETKYFVGYLETEGNPSHTVVVCSKCKKTNLVFADCEEGTYVSNWSVDMYLEE